MKVDVTNTGARAGDEVVQLDVRDAAASLTRRLKELPGFARVSLEPGESRTVTITLKMARSRYLTGVSVR